MNRLTEARLNQTPVLAGSHLQGTFFGSYALLVGTDAYGLVVLNQRLERALSAVQAGRWPVPVTTFQQGHPTAALIDAAFTLPAAQVRLRPAGPAPSYGRTLLHDEPQSVVTWHLIGVSSETELEGRAPGIFGVGSLLGPEAIDDGKASGRLWMTWSGEPAFVGLDTPLHFAVADAAGEVLRAAATAVTQPSTDPATFGLAAQVAARDALLSFDLTKLLRESDGAVPQLDALGQLGHSVRERAAALLAAVHGPDPLVDPLAGKLPTAFTPLTGTAPLSETLVRDFTSSDPLVSGLPGVDMLDGSFGKGDGTTSHLRHRQGFAWPAGTGLRLTVQAADLATGATGEFGVKLCADGDAPENSPPLIELTFTSQWGGRVSTDVGAPQPLGSIAGAAPTDRRSVLPIPRIEGQVYTVYLYPDRKAFVYASGEYLGTLCIPANAGGPGMMATLVMSTRWRGVSLSQLAVEAFEVPSGYVPELPVQPLMTLIDWSTASSVNEGRLTDGNLLSTAFMLSSDRPSVRFNLTEPGNVHINAVLNKSPISENASIRLRAIGGGGTYDSIITALNGDYYWTNVPAGRYELSLSNHSYSVERTEYTEYRTYYDCYQSGGKWYCNTLPGYIKTHIGSGAVYLSQWRFGFGAYTVTSTYQTQHVLTVRELVATR